MLFADDGHNIRNHIKPLKKYINNINKCDFPFISFDTGETEIIKNVDFIKNRCFKYDDDDSYRTFKIATSFSFVLYPLENNYGITYGFSAYIERLRKYYNKNKIYIYYLGLTCYPDCLVSTLVKSSIYKLYLKILQFLNIYVYRYGGHPETLYLFSDYEEDTRNISLILFTLYIIKKYNDIEYIKKNIDLILFDFLMKYEKINLTMEDINVLQSKRNRFLFYKKY